MQLFILYAQDWIDGQKIFSIPLSKRLTTCPTKTLTGRQVSETTYFVPSLTILFVVLSDKTISIPKKEQNPLCTV